MTTITRIQPLPASVFENMGVIGVIITSSLPSYFKVHGVGLDHITSVAWYPVDPSSLEFSISKLSLVSANEGIFMIKILNNYLNDDDRGGKISFRLSSGITLSFPVKTYGPVSYSPLWSSPYEGLSTN